MTTKLFFETVDPYIEMVFQYGWKPLGDGEFVPILAKVDILGTEDGDIAVGAIVGAAS